MDSWRDYRNYPDWALDAFIKRFPSHRDHSLAVSGIERRREDHEQRRGAKDNQPDTGTTLLLDRAIPAWVKIAVIVASIAFGLAALQFFS